MSPLCIFKKLYVHYILSSSKNSMNKYCYYSLLHRWGIYGKKAKKLAKDHGAISTIICQVPLNKGLYKLLRFGRRV